MFEQTPIGFGSLSRPLKGIAISVVGLLLSLGFCGLDAHLYPNAEFGGSLLASIGAFLFVVSGLGLAGSLIALIINALVRAFSK
jgi:hypothetical protein